MHVTQEMSLRDAYQNLIKFSSFFDNMTLQGFGAFCSRNGIEFAKSKDKRRRTSPSDHVWRWQARVLAQDYEENLAKDITMYDQ